MKYPLFKIVFFLIIGIYLEINYHFFQSEIYFLFSIAFLSLFVSESVLSNTSYTKKFFTEFLIALCIVLSGIFLVFFKSDSSSKIYIGNSKEIIIKNRIIKTDLEIYQPIFVSKNSIKINCEVLYFYTNSIKEKYVGKVLLYLPKDSLSMKLLPGDKISVKCSFNRLSNSKNPHQFNYSKYLQSKQIEYSGFVSNWTSIGHSWTLKRFSTIIRNRCLKSFSKSGLKSNELAVASALTFGYKDELSQFVKGVFSKTGAMHVLAVSGLHVGIVYLIISTLFKLFKMSYKFKSIQQLILIFFIWFYAVITGLSPSVLRAATMLTFISVAAVFNKSTNIYNILASSAIFLLVIDPYLISDVGFQLSFFAVCGIIYLYPIIFNMFFINNYFINKIWAISSVSIAAQIATFPISIFYFHQFPNFFLLSNLLVIPLVFVLLILGLCTIAFSFLPYVSTFLAEILTFIISFIVKTLSLIESIPYSLSEGLFISAFETALIYILILLVLYQLKFNLKLLTYLLLIIGILIIVLDLSEDQQALNKKSIIVYSIPNHTAIDLIDGKDHYFIADNKLLVNQKLINIYIKNNWDYNDLRPPKIFNYDSLVSKSIRWNNKSIAFVNEKWNSDSDMDFAIIDKDLTNISYSIFNNPETIFILPDLIYNSKNKININYLSEKSSLIYDLRKSGAYIYNF